MEHAQRVLNASLSLDERLAALQQFKDASSQVDLGQAANQAAWVQTYVQPCLQVLSTVPPSFAEGPAHKLRATALEILSRTPTTEPAKAVAPELVNACLNVVRQDNQENGVPGIKISFEVMKAMKGQLEAQAKQFVDLILSMFQELPATIRLHLEEPSPGAASTATPWAVAATKSLRVLMECPLSVIYVFQLYPDLSSQHLDVVLSVLMNVASSSQPPPAASLHPSRLPALTEVKMLQIKCLQVLGHILRQKPTLVKVHMQAMGNALVDLLRSCPSSLAPRKELLLLMRQLTGISGSSMATMPAAPLMRETVRVRLEELLDDAALLGAGAAANRGSGLAEALRPQAYLVMVEYIHFVRKTLTPSQFSCCAHFVLVIFTAPGSSTALQVMCGKVLVGLAEASLAAAKSSSVEVAVKVRHRALITCILGCFVDRLQLLHRQAAAILEQAKVERGVVAGQRTRLSAPVTTSTGPNSLTPAAAAAALAPPGPAPAPAGEGQHAPEAPGGGQPGGESGGVLAGGALGLPAAPPKAAGGAGADEGGEQEPLPLLSTLTNPGEKEREAMDAKQLAGVLVGSVRTLVTVILNCHRLHQQTLLQQLQQQQQAVGSQAGAAPLPLVAPPLPPGMPAGFLEEELRLLARMWHHALPCLKLVAYQTEAREVCEKFVETFSGMEPKDFVEVLVPNLDAMFPCCPLEDSELVMHVAAHLMAHAQFGRPFCCHLLDFLSASRLHLLEQHEEPQGALVLKLIQLALGAVSNMEGPDVLVAPLVLRLLEACMKAATASAQPAGYLQVVRALFKAVKAAGAKMAGLQAELAAPCALHLAAFTTWLAAPGGLALRPLLLELCLNLPVQVSALIPILPRIARPLLSALTQGPEELVALAVSTLELWVDNFNPEYIEAALLEVAGEVMGALWALLKPGTPLAPRVLAVLGKMGGRNRRCLRDPPRLDYKDNPEFGLRLILTFQPQLSFLTPLDRCMALAKQSLLGASPLGSASTDLYYRKQALSFLQISLASVLNLRSCVAPGAQQPPLHPSGSGVPGGGEPPGPGGLAGGDAVEVLLEVLLGNGPVPSVQPLIAKVEQGVKTKTQLVAERGVLVALVVAIIAASADPRLEDVALPFARHITRHFAMLFVAGTLPPAPGPAMFRHEPRPAPTDPATVGVAAAATATAATAASNGLPQPCAPDAAPGSTTPDAKAAASASAMPQGLRELDVHLFLDALLEVLCDKEPDRGQAALHTLSVFLDTLLVLHQARTLAKKRARATAAEGQLLIAGPALGSGQADVGAAGVAMEGVEGAGAGAEGSRPGSGSAPAQQSSPQGGSDKHAKGERPSAAAALGLPPVLDELYSRLLHCCYEDSWQARLAGAASITLTASHAQVPLAFLQPWAALTVRGLLAALGALPARSKEEQQRMQAGLLALLQRALGLQEEAKDQQPSPQADQAASAVVLSGENTGSQLALLPGPAAATPGVQAAAGDTSTAIGPPRSSASVHDDWVKAVVDVLLEAVLVPSSPSPARTAAIAALDLVSRSLHTSVPDLLAGYLAGRGEAVRIELSSRRLLPLRSVAWAVGVAEAASWWLAQRPCSLAWGPALATLTGDALWLAERDESVLLARLPASHGTNLASLTRLRVAAMRLLCSVMLLPDFQELRSEGPEDKPDGNKAPGAAGGATGSASLPAGASGSAGGDDATKAVAGAEGATANSVVAAGAEAVKSDQGLRRQLTVMLFNNLTSPNEAIWAAAKQGVQILMTAQNNLSKATLQHGLRPLLSSLGDHRKMTLPMLQGLARLLEQLSDWFSHSLGVKLLEHLTRWTLPEGPAAGPKGLAPVAWKAGEELAMAAHILDLFHLLPRQAVQFLESEAQPEPKRLGLVVLVLELEQRLPSLPGHSLATPRIMTSPFRLPLIRYLNKYATEAVAYFLDPSRLCNERYTNRLHDLLRTQPAAQPLLQAFAQSEERLLPLLAMGIGESAEGAEALGAVGGPDPGPGGAGGRPTHAAAPYNAVHLVALLVKLMPQWLVDKPRLVAALRARWHRPQRTALLAAEEEAPRWRLLEGKALATCLLAYTAATRTDPSLLFDLFSITLAPTLAYPQALDRFCQDVTSWSSGAKRSLVLAFISAYRSRTYSYDHLERILQMLVLPLLSHSLEQEEQGVVDAEVVELLACHLLGLQPAPGAAGAPGAGGPGAAGQGQAAEAMAAEQASGGQGSEAEGQLAPLPSKAAREDQATTLSNDTAALPDALQIALLKLTTLLLKQARELLSHTHQKQVIGFCWSFLRHDNKAVASHAYLAVAHYVRTTLSPEHIVLQVLMALLKATQPEVKKGLVKEALDLVLPVLHQRRYVAMTLDAAAASQPPATPSASLAGAGPEPKWVRCIKTVLAEESGSMSSVLHCWLTVLRHAGLLYAYHPHLQQTMLTAITRLGAQPQAECRRLALDLVATLLAWERRRQAEEAAGAAGSEGGAQPAAGPDGEEGGGHGQALAPKRRRADSPSGPDHPLGQPLKTSKLSDGSAAPTQPSPPRPLVPDSAAAAPLSAAGPPAPPGLPDSIGSWRPSSSVQDQLASYLIRMALTLLNSSEAARDEEVALQSGTALHLLAQAARLWPGVTVKAAYLERLIPNHMHAAQAAAPPLVPGQVGPSCCAVPQMLTCGLSIVKGMLAPLSDHLLVCAHTQLAALMEPCCQTHSWPSVLTLCSALRQVASWPLHPGDDTQQAARQATQKVLHDMDTAVQRHIGAAISDLAPSGGPLQLGAHPQVLSGLCCSLAMLEAVADRVPAAAMLSYLPLLLKALVKAVRETASTALALVNQQQQQAAAAAAGAGGRGRASLTTPAPPLFGSELEYGSLGWAVASCLRLCAPHVMHNSDHRKALLSSMVNLLVGQHAKGVEPALYLEMLLLVERWVVRPLPGQGGTLAHKEVILLCQRLGMLERNGVLQGAHADTRAAFETAFLRVMLQLNTLESLPKELRDDAFHKVERFFMMGLRTQQPATRRAFFDLYNTHVPPTLYDRLHFILFSHDWEPLANQFWLKHALDLIFAVLKEDEDILLAFNSSQVPPLMPGTKQNIFSPALHLNQQPAAQQGQPGLGSGTAAGTKEEQQQGRPESVPKPEPGLVKQEELGSAAGNGPMPSGANGLASAAGLKSEGGGAGPGGAASLLPAGSVARADVAPEVVDMLTQHVDFLQKTGQLRVRDMMVAVREYLHADTHMAYHLWVLMFPIVWATLEKVQQVTLAKPIIALLSKEYHHRQASARPNVVQAMLDGIAVSQPQPKIPPELIKFLGKTYNAWQIAIPLLESHVVMFPNDTRCFDSLVELYKRVSEEDMMYGLWRRRCTTEITRAALSLVQAGQLDKAEEVLGEATRAAAQGMLPQLPSRGECALWVEQWINCAKSLNHWDLLTDYSRTTEQFELLADCSWRSNDWDGLKEVLNNSKSALDDSPSMVMIKGYMALHENDTVMCDTRMQQATAFALQRCWQLPEIGAAPQVPLLQTFQQLVEVRESVRILADLQLGASTAEHAFQDVRDTTDTWRLRTPNEWEALPHWHDVMVWRNHIYDIVISNFRNFAESNPQLYQLGYRDKAWSVNRLGAIATAHGLPETCLNILNTMYGYNAMEVQEAFVKIREQANAYMDQPSELLAGYNLLATTNLDYFGPQHQAEIYRLKGSILAALKDCDAAHNCFSSSLHLWRHAAEAWTAWGGLCDEQWEASLQPPPSPAPQPSRGPQPFMLEYTVHCYVQGVRLGSASARALLPRLLHLLSFDNDSSAAQSSAWHANGGPASGWSQLVSQAMQRSGAYELPAGVWVPWLPQLLMSLARPESGAVKPLLQLMATVLPQAPYYSLRSYLVAMRELISRSNHDMRARHSSLAAQQQQSQALQAAVAAAHTSLAEVTAAGGDTGPVQTSLAALQDKLARSNQAAALATQALAALDTARQAEVAAFEVGREVSELIRTRHPALHSTLEHLVIELGSRFSPRQEERLLAVVNALLHRCYKVPYASQAEVPALMKKELAGVCKACFQDSSGAAGAGQRSSRSGVTMAMREEFVKDMNPDSAGFPPTLGGLMEHLKAWRARLLSELEERIPSLLRLEDEAPGLRELPLVDVEMPGMYAALAGCSEGPTGLAVPLPGTSGAGPAEACPVLLESFGSGITIVRRQGSAHRRLMLHGSDGRVRHMIVLQSQNWLQHTTDERILQLLRGFNRLLDAQPQARSRNLQWYIPLLVPVQANVRLLEEDLSFTSYGEAYEVNCTRYGREADLPIVHFKKRCSQPNTGAMLHDSSAHQLRLMAFNEICDKVVNENVFSQYIYKTLPSCNHLWVFKKAFCTHMALSGLLCHLLLLGGRAPPKILFAKDSGRVLQSELMPVYNEKGALDRVEHVPFRLTRNMYTFFTTFGVEGVFLTAMINAAQAVLHKQGNAQHLLSLFFRDDIAVWHARRGNAKSMLGSIKNDTLKLLVVANVRKTLDRARQVAPQPFGDDTIAALLAGTARSTVNAGVAELVEQAINPKLLSRMEATWHPWF